MSARHLLVLVEEPTADGKDGGVQKEVDVLEEACGALGVSAVRTPLAGVTATLRRLGAGMRVVVFTQQEGGLSPRYARWAGEWLSGGATVVEKNVFAMPSPWRPRHPRYVMALMSKDGAYRLRLRGLLGGASRTATWLHLRNPCDAGHPLPGDRDTDVDLHFLRVGRPDPRKWSSFETAFVRQAAAALPDMRFRLTLVGAPDSGTAPPVPRNVELVTHPYLPRRRLDGLYSRAHAYLHHSRIGETFGNTVAEAVMNRTRIVFAAEPRWDCAPVEFAPPGSITGTPRHLCRTAPEVVRRLLAAPASPAKGIPDSQELVTRLVSVADDPAQATVVEPTVGRSVRYMMTLPRRIEGASLSGCAKAVGVEVARGYRKTRSSR